MKAPAFWWTPEPTLAATLLTPAGFVYGALTAARMGRAGAPAGVPVLCVGNLVAGGAGKTPTALALGRLLQERGRRPAFLSRGYGRAKSAPSKAVLAVDATHTADIAGDEPLLLAQVAPTFVAADRRLAAREAVAHGADMLILDDGLQNPVLSKDWTLAVADGASGLGNGKCLPAGPLRAPVARQWPFVSMLCVIGEGEPGRLLARMAADAGVPTVAARLDADADVLAGLRGHRLLAFAGIGRPEKFYAMLRDAGLDLAATRSFPDHHRFRASDLQGLTREAFRLGARLVTTAKDRVRLPESFPAQAIPVRLSFDQPAAITDALVRLR